MNKQKVVKVAMFVAVMAIVLVGSLAAQPDHVSTAPVMWTFEDPAYPNPAGTSTLNRSANGISANYETSGLTPGHTATLWFIVFNYPGLCSDGECGLDDLGDTPAQGDFLLAAGHVIGSDGEETFSGHLSEGDVSGSGLHEVACPETKDCGIGLQDAEGALVVLALHSHGPAATGQLLVEQISSFTGGCEVFQDPDNDGFANDPSDIPDAPGECSTMQVSPHAP